MPETIKNCPFCGSDDVWPCASNSIDNLNEILSVYISCNKCNAQGPEVNICGEFPTEEKMKQQAIKLWNERS